MDNPESMHTQTHATEHERQRALRANVNWKLYLTVSAIYLIVALVAFAAVTAGMFNTATGVGGDTYLNLWDIWWVNYATFTLHTSFWSTSLVFYPVGENLVFHTLAPLTGFLAGPFALVSLPFAYDSMFFIGFMLSGLTMYILADYFLQNKYAAFIAGFMFAFSAASIDHALDLLIYTQIEWIPLALYFFIRMVKEKKIIYAVGLGVCVMLATFMGNIEQTIMIVVLLFVVLVAYMFYKETRQHVISFAFVRNIIIAIVVCFIVGIWGFLPLINTILQPGALSLANSNNTAQYNELWSADLLTFFVPSYYNSVFYPLLANSNLYLPDPAERIAYIGYTVLVLSILALYKSFKSARLWLIVAVVFALLSLGPSILVNGYSTGIPTLYNIYHAVPGINIIREPGRFAIITALGFAMLAAIGAKYILENWKTSMEGKKFALVLTVVVCLFYLFEVNGLVLAGPVTAATTTQVVNPPLYTQLAAVKGNFSTLTLPALPSSGTEPDLYPGMATYYQTLSNKAIVGGLDGRQNETQLLSLYNVPLVVIAEQLELNLTPEYESPVLQNYTNQSVLAMYSYGTAFLILDKNAFSQADLSAFAEYLLGVFGPPVYNDNTTIAFSTSNAISKVFEKSYVAYPVLTDWEQASIYVNGSQRVMWIPIEPGVINVYAPYANQSVREAGLFNGVPAYINTTIKLQAISAGPSAQLLIEELTSSGQAVLVTQFNLTNKLETYGVNTTLASGPRGNAFFFLTRNSSSSGFSVGSVVLQNITFSYDRT